MYKHVYHVERLMCLSFTGTPATLPSLTRDGSRIRFTFSFVTTVTDYSLKATRRRIQSAGLDCCSQNPVGLAAGFDKNGIALRPLAALGFGFIEAGTVTFHPQPGNPRPRLFRLSEDQALINRAGFNNEGAAAFAKRVEHNRPDCVLGVSIGKSKITPLEEATDDYLASFELVYNVADYIAVNVSSPNTPQLRELQQSQQLTGLLSALQARGRELEQRHQKRVPLLVKLSPDLERRDLEMIVEVIENLHIDGIIATNTTISRENLRQMQSWWRQPVKAVLAASP